MPNQYRTLDGTFDNISSTCKFSRPTLGLLRTHAVTGWEMLTLDNIMGILGNTGWAAFVQQILHVLGEFQVGVRFHQVIDHRDDD